MADLVYVTIVAIFGGAVFAWSIRSRAILLAMAWGQMLGATFSQPTAHEMANQAAWSLYGSAIIIGVREIVLRRSARHREQATP